MVLVRLLEKNFNPYAITLRTPKGPVLSLCHKNQAHFFLKQMLGFSKSLNLKFLAIIVICFLASTGYVGQRLGGSLLLNIFKVCFNLLSLTIKECPTSYNYNTIPLK